MRYVLSRMCSKVTCSRGRLFGCVVDPPNSSNFESIFSRMQTGQPVYGPKCNFSVRRVPRKASRASNCTLGLPLFASRCRWTRYGMGMIPLRLRRVIVPFWPLAARYQLSKESAIDRRFLPGCSKTGPKRRPEEASMSETELPTKPATNLPLLGMARDA